MTTPKRPEALGSTRTRAEEAREVLAQEARERSRNCLAEIAEVLARHHCKLTARFVLEPPNKITPLIDVIPED